MNVICMEEDAFYSLLDEVISYVKQKEGIKEDKWIPSSEAMRILNIKSRSTLQALRDNGKVRYTKPNEKIILYDRTSINEYLEENAKDIF